MQRFGTTNRITGSPYAYGLNGNMTGDGLNTLTYDGENRVVTSATGGTTSSYTYDGKNLRVKKQVGSATATVYIFSGSKVVAEYAAGAGVGSPTREYIYSGSQLLATIEGSTTKYHHADHLSVRVTSDTSGNVLGQQGHYPFGEQWYPALPQSPATKWQFTSYERDGGANESGNDYAMMRYHVNRLGRFSSPDPIAGGLANPQSLNRYAYVLNDPGNLIDPKGTISVNLPFGIDPLFVLAAIGPHTGVTVYGDAPNEETILLGSGPLEQLLAGHQGGRGGPGAPKPPGLPGFSQAAYSQCANQAFGSTSGTIPGTDRSIPGYAAALAIFQASLLTGADTATVAGTMAFESNFNLAVATQFNPGTLSTDVGPMQLNTGNIGESSFPIFPGAYGSAVVGEPFNGDVLANVMTGANYLNRLGRHPENYTAPVYRRGRRRGLGKVDQYLRSFFDCLARNSVPTP